MPGQRPVPANLRCLAVSAEHAGHADPLELLGEESVSQSAHPELVPEQRVAVEGPPQLVFAVGPLGPVRDGVVHVELHEAVAGVVLLK